MSEQRFPWRTLLFASAALNLLVIGAAAGAFGAGVRLERQTPGAMVDRMPGPRAFIRDLPEETRLKMREELAETWVETGTARQTASQARREAFAAIAEEPYDAARVRAAFARVRAADQTAIAVFHDNMAEAFGELTPEQRREALAALRTAAPASRANLSEPESDQAPGGAIERRPEQRRDLDERRQERRERWRERRQQRQGNP